MDFPIDVLFTPVEEDRVAWGSITAPSVSLPGPDQDAVEEALKLLKAAKRPAIIVSTGARNVRPQLSLPSE